ncbi:Transcription factor EB [Fasciola gigantica]|uniref:Transcription factor EB n=1 Tax=Fasciola gigantica TaxID=46835 RepID=A0A504YR70_FASGI|nr:Transcription factor EB [Fasciola gigantica]
MMTHLGEMEEELDEGVVADHLRGHDLNSFRDHGYLQFANFDKTEQSWMNSLSHQRNPAEDSSPQTRSHLSPEPTSDLTSPLPSSGFLVNSVSTDVGCPVPMDSNFTETVSSFDYTQRLPSLEGSSSAPIGRSVPGLTSQSWHPFATNSVQNHSQASSFHGPGGHLFPVFSGTIGLYGNEFGSNGTANNTNNNVSVNGTTPITIPCILDSHGKQDSQFSQANSYVNHVSAAAASATAAAAALSGTNTGTGVVTRMRASLGSPPSAVNSNSSTTELQPIRLDSLGLSGTGVGSATSTTPVPNYPPSAGSSNSQSSTPAHQTFGYGSNGSSVSQLNASQTNLAGGSFYEENTKTVTIKQRSKKESHNRIERKRRDYINSQIVYLSSLLPPELYRDVDGRRNKGSVLRLSVNYIMELREAVSRMNGLKQENALAQQLIPLLLKRIEVLEQNSEMRSSTGSTNSPPTASPRGSGSFESLYQSWLLMTESNQRANNLGNSGSLGAGSARSSTSDRLGQTGGQPGSVGPDSSYFPDLMMQTNATTDAESEVDSGVSGAGLIRVTGSVSSQHRNMVNVKREQSEEEQHQQRRLSDSATSRMRVDSRRVGVGVTCTGRSSFGELSNPERIDEEVSPMDSGVYGSQSNSAAYERYQRILQQARQPSLFGHNE